MSNTFFSSRGLLVLGFVLAAILLIMHASTPAASSSNTGPPLSDLAPPQRRDLRSTDSNDTKQVRSTDSPTVTSSPFSTSSPAPTSTADAGGGNKPKGRKGKGRKYAMIPIWRGEINATVAQRQYGAQNPCHAVYDRSAAEVPDGTGTFALRSSTKAHSKSKSSHHHYHGRPSATPLRVMMEAKNRAALPPVGAASPELRERITAIARETMPEDLRSWYLSTPAMPLFTAATAKTAGTNGSDTTSSGSILKSEQQTQCPDWPVAEQRFMRATLSRVSAVLRDGFPADHGGSPAGGGLHWWLDEGTLLGSARGGSSLHSRDDDLDMVVLAPFAASPCADGTSECTLQQHNRISAAVMEALEDAGLCVMGRSSVARREGPPGGRLSKTEAPKKLRYYNDPLTKFSTAMIDATIAVAVPPVEGDCRTVKVFTARAAHIHIAHFASDGRIRIPGVRPAHTIGLWQTWWEAFPAADVIPIHRCRLGPELEAPCPGRPVRWLAGRNRGEYRGDDVGKCVLSYKSWSEEKKTATVALTTKLAQCGYGSMIEVAKCFVEGGMRDC